jgi:hypothetical protein
MTKRPWDLFYMHSHPPDWAYHILLSDMDEHTTKSKEAYDKAWEIHLKIYQGQDRMLARIVEAAGKDALIVLVSDHGAVADGPAFNPYYALVPAGLSTLKDPKDTVNETMAWVQSAFTTENEKDIANQRMNMAKNMSERYGKIPEALKSKAIAQRSCHIYVNLKGREPEGIVDLKDYEKTQQEIIDALYSYVDPNTGKSPVALALSKKDARIIGHYGDRSGDVIYAIYPWFGSQHGQMLPTASWGLGDLRALLSFTGPGIKKGHRLERTCWLTDLVPTICYLMDWPVPEQTDGCVIYQAFKDPNFKLEEVNKIKDAISRMETALARQAREPWDKHDCA